ncbi:hypothetical protein QTP88_018969 [Uroleucon formosanum]
MIKLSSLLDEVFVDETQIYQLKGINEYLVHTIGSVTLDVQFGAKVEPTNFQVVRDDFPVPHEGILGKPFLVNNGLIIDYQASKITQSNEEPIQVAPRTETIIAISTTTAEGSTFVIHSQTIGGENIRLGNVLSTVKQRQLLAVVVNCTENPVTLQPLQLKDVFCSEYQESTMLVATHSQREPVDTNRLKSIKETLQTEHLNPEECNSLWRICREFTNIFHLSGDTLTSTTTIHHEIRTPENATPINVRPYRLPYDHRQEIIKQTKELEENKIIQPSDSPWNAPLIVVPKKPDAQGKPQYRVCVDFRRLNQITVGDAFPIPRIDEILDQLGRSRYYSTLDLASGYHQVPIREEDRQKTAFSTDKGHYEFIQMPFGLSGAPSTFQRLMNSVLIGINGVKAFVYLDDIIIYATDLRDHESKLREKNVPFEWTIEAQIAFDTLKEKLINAPILQYPNFEKEFILTTDASQFAIGSILSQGIPGQDLPIAYASRTLNKAEQAYSTTEKELLSIVWAVKHFRPYLLGREFKIFTDHQPLTWLFNVKDPGSRLMRWRLKLAEYNYEVVYKPGVINTNADALSRIGEVKIIRTRSQTSQEDKGITLKSFEEYMEDPASQNVKNSNVHEAFGDIFETPEEFHLVHCVSGDLKLSRGIALEFRRRYGHIEKLKQQHPKKTELDAREMLSEQVTGISLLLTQLLHIVNSAIHGQAHPSLMTHQQYVEHLREIQLTLPIGSNLPFPLEKFSITKFIQVTKVAILLANNTLIFIQKIPLISSNSYKGYRLIPFPVRQQGQTYSIFTSVPSVLALSSNREYFIPLTESQLGNCKRIDTSLYCSQITCMYSSTNTICGVNSLLGLKENSSVCKVQYVKITNSIFSRLESTNTWLYVSVSENVAIKCDNEDPHNIILNGTGQLTLNPQCVLYAKQTILFPSQTIVRNSSQNLYNPIQSEGLGSLSVTNISQDLFESLNFSESHYSIGLEDLARHSKSLTEIEELIKVEKNTNYVPKESNLYLIISLVIISTILITLLSSLFCFVKYTARKPIMYQPRDVVAETQI